MMKVLVATTLAAGLVFAAGTAFAQTPAPVPPPGTPTLPGTPVNPVGRGNPDRAQDHAENHQKWEDCMRQQEEKYGGVKTVGQHANANNANGKGSWKGMSKGKPMPPDEKADAKKGEKENRHQAEMDDCREQLYGRDGPPAGKK